MPVEYVVMLGGTVPPSGEGRLWRAVDGDPAFRRIVHVTADIVPEPDAVPEDVEIWVGTLRFSTVTSRVPPEGAGGLLVFAQEPRPGDEDEFDAWMDTEHVPALGGVSGTLAAQRFEALVGAPRFSALYYLVEPSVCTSDEWRSASRTPWRARMSERNINRRRGLFVPADGP